MVQVSKTNKTSSQPVLQFDCTVNNEKCRLQLFSDQLNLIFDLGQKQLLQFTWQLKALVKWSAAGEKRQVAGLTLINSENQSKWQIQGSLQNKAILYRHLRNKFNFMNFHQSFSISRKIGVGSQASIYKGVQLQNGETVAVRAIKKKPSKLDYIKNQISIIRSLSHDNIIKIKQVYQSANTIYIITELLQGGSLFDFFLFKHKFLPREIKSMLHKLVNVLVYLQMNGIVHRDIKPQNILIRDRSCLDIVLIDFGHAIRLRPEQEALNQIAGTSGYCAPQLFQPGAFQSRVSDVFSLGVILYILMTQNEPYDQSENVQVEVLNRQCRFFWGNPKFIRLKDQQKELIRQMLEKDFRKRITPAQILKHSFLTGTKAKDPTSRHIKLLRTMSLNRMYDLHPN